jgi:hypothetical protein
MPWPRTGVIFNSNITYVSGGACLTSAPTSSCGSGSGSGNGGASGLDNAIVGSVLFSNMNVKYFKINLESTVTNIYQESLEKWYYTGLNVRCSIDRGVTSNAVDEFGVNIAQTINVTIPKALLISYNFMPEVGDIVMDRERYYEVNSIDSQFITIPGVSAGNEKLGTSGQTLTYTLTCHLTRVTKLNLIEYYV